MTANNDARTTTRREAIAGVTVGISTLAMQAADSSAAPATPEISRTAESIHQEIAFGFAPARLYAALTDAQQFQKAVLLSAAVKSGMVSAEVPAKIVATPGGAFSLFAGHISGRFIELVPGQRIVQAWRAGDWAAGIFSIARFELSGAAGGTKLVFDHTGFPAGQADHLAAGWQANYWDPLSRLLSGS